MASLKHDKLQSFQRVADEWLVAGQNDKIVDFIDSILNSNDQKAISLLIFIFSDGIEEYMDGQKLISRKLFQVRLNDMMEVCATQLSTMGDKMLRSCQRELSIAMQ